jgi:guanylate kinase
MVSQFKDTFHGAISCTTRDPRQHERADIDIHFTDATTFAQDLINGDIVEASFLDGDIYGTRFEDLDPDKINIKPMSIEGIQCLLDDSRIEVIPIYIAAEGKTRLMRVLRKQTNPDCEKICEKFLEEEKKYSKDLPFNYYTYYNGERIDLSAFPHFLERYGFLTKID